MSEQKRADPDWEDVRVFLALARHGSLSAAARALSVNHTTISRRMQSLEATLGERLVDRRPDGFVLTPAGTRALASASEMEAAAAVLGRGGADDRPKGFVRINAPPTLSQVFLAPRLPELCIKYDGLDVNLAADVRNVSLERRETDLALRFGRPEDGDVIAKQMAVIGFGFYGTEAVRERVAKGSPPVFVGFDELNAYLPEAQWLSKTFPRARMSFRASNQTLQAAAARAGGGIALLPHFVGRTTPGLMHCTLENTPPSRELWLITRTQDRKELSIRTVIDYLAALFWEEREMFQYSSEQPPVDRILP